MSALSKTNTLFFLFFFFAMTLWFQRFIKVWLEKEDMHYIYNVYMNFSANWCPNQRVFGEKNQTKPIWSASTLILFLNSFGSAHSRRVHFFLSRPLQFGAKINGSVWFSRCLQHYHHLTSPEVADKFLITERKCYCAVFRDLLTFEVWKLSVISGHHTDM